MPADKPTELSRIKLKNLNSTARPYDQQAFSPPDPTVIWHSHLALAIYIFVVVRVGFLPEETYFFRDTRKKVEETYFFQFCPDKTGRNWTKVEKTVKDVRNAGKK